MNQYRPYIRGWMECADKQHCHPLTPPVGIVLGYLSTLFDRGLGYSAINTARSALSTLIIFYYYFFLLKPFYLEG